MDIIEFGICIGDRKIPIFWNPDATKHAPRQYEQSEGHSIYDESE
jgi:hypothetical protein